MPTPQGSMRGGRAWLWDGSLLPSVAFALVLAAVQVSGSHFAAHKQPDREPLDGIALVLLLAGPALLVARRRRPVAVLVSVLGVTLLYVGLGYPYGPVFLSSIIALSTAVVEGHRLAAWIAAAAFLLADTGLELLLGRESPLSFGDTLGVVAWLLVVLVVSEVVRVRRDRAAAAARSLAEEARRRESEERLRIARELHDVLAHNISLINVQAGVALHLIDEQPEQARTALASIKQASKDVLRELRSTLGVLRQVDEEAPRSPGPSLGRLEELVARARDAGLDVRTETTGSRRALPAAVDAAAFRIIQEALTNVARHARASATVIRLGFGERELRIEVEDDGRGSGSRTPGDAGHGILGMRERAGALGGDLLAGPGPAGGFLVSARLPLESDA